MSRKYKFQDQDKLYFVTYTLINWIDLFTRNIYKDIILNSLEHCVAKKGLEVYAWCIMTNHVHLIIGTHGNNMEHILRDHKSFTAEKLYFTIVKNTKESRRGWILQQMQAAGRENSNNTNYQVWQQHNKPIELYSHDVILKYLNYLHHNPVRAGFVEYAEDWLYSSAKDYAGKTGLLKCLTPIDIAINGD
jgi:putative transposase